MKPLPHSILFGAAFALIGFFLFWQEGGGVPLVPALLMSAIFGAILGGLFFIFRRRFAASKE